MPTEDLPPFDDECFFIAPIGSEGTQTRDRSDGVLEYIVAPAARALGLVAIRADKIAKPGQITRQVIEHVVGAKAAVVDLTEANPNVYYEMAVRHTAQSPTVLIAQLGETLPFDISQMRTIFFDYTSLKSAAECQNQITQHLREALGGEVDSPIAASVTVRRLEQGTSQERVLAQLVDGVDEVRTRLRHLEGRSTGFNMPRQIRRDLERGLSILQQFRNSSGMRELDEVLEALERPARYLADEGSIRAMTDRMEIERRMAEREEELRVEREELLVERDALMRFASERRADHEAAVRAKRSASAEGTADEKVKRGGRKQ